MQYRRFLFLPVLIWAASAAQAQSTDGPVSVKDPKAFATLLKDMGYKPGEVTSTNGLPMITVDIADQPTNILFGGCSMAENCTYIVLSSSYSDVTNPPERWITKMNDAFDIIKIGLNAKQNLYFSAAHVIDGVPRSTLREIFEFWARDASALATEAVKAKLNKAK